MSDKPDEPFGRQPQPVVVSFTGDLRDVEAYIQKFTRIIEQGSYDTITRMGNQLKIHPRAVND